MPRLWWLSPWSAACYLHEACEALKSYADRADRAIDIQCRVISDQSEEIRRLRERVADLYDEIIRGRAVIPDAEPEGGRAGVSHQKAAMGLAEGSNGSPE